MTKRMTLTATLCILAQAEVAQTRLNRLPSYGKRFAERCDLLRNVRDKERDQAEHQCEYERNRRSDRHTLPAARELCDSVGKRPKDSRHHDCPENHQDERPELPQE